LTTTPQGGDVLLQIAPQDSGKEKSASTRAGDLRRSRDYSLPETGGEGAQLVRVINVFVPTTLVWPIEGTPKDHWRKTSFPRTSIRHFRRRRSLPRDCPQRGAARRNRGRDVGSKSRSALSGPLRSILSERRVACRVRAIINASDEVSVIVAFPIICLLIDRFYPWPEANALLLILSEKTETLDRRTTALSDKMKENGLMCRARHLLQSGRMQAFGTFIEEADFPAHFEKPDWGSLKELAAAARGLIKLRRDTREARGRQGKGEDRNLLR